MREIERCRGPVPVCAAAALMLAASTGAAQAASLEDDPHVADAVRL